LVFLALCHANPRFSRFFDHGPNVEGIFCVVS
jgi:hypothetical protein